MDISLLSRAPFHIISYGTVLGATVFHTLSNQHIISSSLPIQLSAYVLANIYPPYFMLQTVGTVVMALTFPSSGGVMALWWPGNRWQVMFPMACMFVTGFSNWTAVLPAAIEYSLQIDELEDQVDAAKDESTRAKIRSLVEAKRTNYLRLQALGGVLNAGTMFGAVAYGLTLSSRLRRWGE
ncbi:hypothetical protein QBC39DRAFT_364803 [Podospora conica]|nr:hypothetical protein QBC39DRAFT_364803 [Schizothecium conicum]